MNQLSDRLNSLSPSATLAMSQKSSELKAQGVDVINLSVGEPDFNTPDHIKEAAKKAIDENYSRYSPVAGYPALRNAIVAKLKNENGLEYTAAQISCANGAKQSVCNTILALVNKGDEVMSENTQNLLILLAVGIPTAYIYLRRRQNRIRQEMLEQRQRSKLQSSQSGDADSIPEEAEVILGELTELRLKQAETLAQIEDIQNGRNVEVNVCREYGQSTTLSQESILQALQVEDKTLSQQIRRKSLEFAEIVKQ